MLDQGEADDKIIAVLENDQMWSGVNDVSELPTVLVDRLRHYFSVYKALTPDEAAHVKIDAAYGRDGRDGRQGGDGGLRRGVRRVRRHLLSSGAAGD